MQNLQHHFSRIRCRSSKIGSSLLRRSSAADLPPAATDPGSSLPRIPAIIPFSLLSRHFSAGSGDGKDDGWNDAWKGNPAAPDLGWDEAASSWSTGLTEDHFDGKAVGRRQDSKDEVAAAEAETPPDEDFLEMMERDNRKNREFVDGWGKRMKETVELLKQVREPGARGSYLKDSQKAEMYRLHKENPEEYTVERLAKDYRIMRQRVHAILWLKEIEEEEEKKLGRPLDDSVEQLLDTCPEFFVSHDREFHVASLPYKADFKIMPEDWDGTARDHDEVHYEISKREDEILYREFVQKMNFNKMKMAGQVKCHKYSRRRPDEGWNFTVEKLGEKDKRPGSGGAGWRFVSQPDGSSRPLNDTEKMYAKRETVRRRRRILP